MIYRARNIYYSATRGILQSASSPGFEKTTAALIMILPNDTAETIVTKLWEILPHERKSPLAIVDYKRSKDGWPSDAAQEMKELVAACGCEVVEQVSAGLINRAAYLIGEGKVKEIAGYVPLRIRYGF